MEKSTCPPRLQPNRLPFSSFLRLETKGMKVGKREITHTILYTGGVFSLCEIFSVRFFFFFKKCHFSSPAVPSSSLLLRLSPPPLSEKVCFQCKSAALRVASTFLLYRTHQTTNKNPAFCMFPLVLESPPPHAKFELWFPNGPQLLNCFLLFCRFLVLFLVLDCVAFAWTFDLQLEAEHLFRILGPLSGFLPEIENLCYQWKAGINAHTHFRSFFSRPLRAFMHAWVQRRFASWFVMRNTTFLSNLLHSHLVLPLLILRYQVKAWPPPSPSPRTRQARSFMLLPSFNIGLPCSIWSSPSSMRSLL